MMRRSSIPTINKIKIKIGSIIWLLLIKWKFFHFITSDISLSLHFPPSSIAGEAKNFWFSCDRGPTKGVGGKRKLKISITLNLLVIKYKNCFCLSFRFPFGFLSLAIKNKQTNKACAACANQQNYRILIKLLESGVKGKMGKREGKELFIGREGFEPSTA